MNPQQQEQVYAAKLHSLAAAARKCPRAEVRQLWNPKRQWSMDRLGGVAPDPQTLKCRQEIIRQLKKHGPLTASKLFRLLPGFGYRRRQNAKDWLVTNGKIEVAKQGGSKRFVYRLTEGGGS